MTEFEVHIDLDGRIRPIGMARSNRVRARRPSFSSMMAPPSIWRRVADGPESRETGRRSEGPAGQSKIWLEREAVRVPCGLCGVGI